MCYASKVVNTLEPAMPTAFASKLARTASGQWDSYHFDSEDDPKLGAQIKSYWLDLGLAFPGVSTAWSAVFVSWCVKKAGATPADFRFEIGRAHV